MAPFCHLLVTCLTISLVFSQRNPLELIPQLVIVPPNFSFSCFGPFLTSEVGSGPVKSAVEPTRIVRPLRNCYWVGSLDFNFLGNQGSFSTKPPNSYSLFAGGSTATKANLFRVFAPFRSSLPKDYGETAFASGGAATEELTSPLRCPFSPLIWLAGCPY